MRNFKLLLVFFTFVLSSCFCLDKKLFEEKLNQPAPFWVQEQISEDLEVFKEFGISQHALNATVERSANRMLANWNQVGKYDAFARFRIIDNSVYLKKGTGPTNYLGDALVTLSRLVRLPDVDFIVALTDGVPESYHAKDFWVAENFSEQAPLFCRSKKTWAKYVAILPDYTAFSDNNGHIAQASRAHPWETKIKKAFWRGSPSDFWDNAIGRHSYETIKAIYSTRPRFLLSKYSVLYPEFIDAGITSSFGHAPNLGTFLIQEGVALLHK